MKFINIKNQSETGKILADKIGEYLKQDKKVLWLLSGGSNISIAVEALNILKKDFSSVIASGAKQSSLKDNLAVTLTDERFGPVGHKDSNWQQLLLGGFDMSSVYAVPILCGMEPKETVIEFGKKYRDLTAEADVIIGQFGLGADGHTAGVLPNTIGVKDQGTSCFYDGGKFKRVTLTLKTIRNINIAYTFAFGESKKEIVKSIQSKNIPLEAMPAQVLNEIEESYLYSDQI